MLGYRKARRETFDDALAVLETSARNAALTMADQLDPERWRGCKRSSILVNAAARLLDRAFKAQDSVKILEELEELGAVIDALKAGAGPVVIEKPEASMDNGNDHEEAEAAVLRVTWMGEIGNSPEDIADSLRYNRPTSVVEEQKLLELVRKMAAETAEATDATSGSEQP